MMEILRDIEQFPETAHDHLAKSAQIDGEQLDKHITLQEQRFFALKSMIESYHIDEERSILWDVIVQNTLLLKFTELKVLNSLVMVKDAFVAHDQREAARHMIELTKTLELDTK
eukprot:m.126614 g.126614  ORF g.126614 m.126614 type:complete len:114 (+) comp9394_c0_seq1:429-770(+)